MIFNQIEADSYQAGPFGLYKTLSTSKEVVNEFAEEFVSWTQPAQPFETKVVNLSVIDQAVVRCWSSYVLCFQMPPDQSSRQIFGYLKQGLQETIEQFPFISGSLATKDGAKEGSLQVNIGPESGVAFGFRDLSQLPIANDLTFEKLRQCHFPPSMVESPELCIAPDAKTIESAVRQPVFLAQATFVRGGVLLFFAHSHQIADVTGTNSIMRTWSQNVSAITTGVTPHISEALRQSSLDADRRRLSNGDVDKSIPESSFPMVIDRSDVGTRPLPAKVPNQDQNPSMIWYVDKARLQDLKNLARPIEGKDAYISTLDALNALMWRAICRARRLRERGIPISRLFFVCDIRSKLQPPIRPDSTCNATMKLHAAQACADIQDQDLATSLAACASSIRLAIRNFSQSLFETWIAYVKSAPSFLSLKAKENLCHGPDVVVTDHSKVSAYQYVWGPLGSIERIRNPWWARSMPKPYSQVTLMPRLRDGGLEILTNFEEEVNHRLLEDPELRQFASIRCC